MAIKYCDCCGENPAEEEYVLKVRYPSGQVIGVNVWLCPTCAEKLSTYLGASVWCRAQLDECGGA